MSETVEDILSDLKRLLVSERVVQVSSTNEVPFVKGVTVEVATVDARIEATAHTELPSLEVIRSERLHTCKILDTHKGVINEPVRVLEFAETCVVPTKAKTF